MSLDGQRESYRREEPKSWGGWYYCGECRDIYGLPETVTAVNEVYKKGCSFCCLSPPGWKPLYIASESEIKAAWKGGRNV